jgi:glycosyltransferase involved in cell wall biosynthesis
MNPKVSIITATYNSAATVADTILSVKKQTYKNIEHLIIDGCSTDETIQIIEKQNVPVSIHQEKDKGIYDAMNKGIKYTTGDIVGILNSDDFYADDTVVEKVVTCFQDETVQAVYGDLWYVDANETNKVKRKWQAGNYTPNSFLWGWMPPHPTFFVRKSVYDTIGTFNLDVFTAADYEFMLRCLYVNKMKAVYLPKVLVHMRMGGASNTTIKNRLLANKGDRMAWTINQIKPYWFTLYAKPLRKILQFI